jgi:hypothetical protein
VYNYLKQKKVFFSKTEEGREVKTGPIWGLVPVGFWEDIRKGEYDGNVIFSYMKMEQ